VLQLFFNFGVMLRLISFLLVFTIVRLANAQNFTVFNYSIPEGLPSSEVYEVFEDRNGFIWLATDHGIVRFDGQEMQVFQMKDGLTDPVVFGFQEDDKGRIWFRTYSGRLCYFENGKILAYPFNDKLEKFTMNGLIQFTYIADLDELWFSVRNREGRISKDGTLKIDTLGNDYRDAVTYKTDGDKELLVLTSRTPYLKWLFINEQKFPIVATPHDYINKVVNRIKWKGNLYISAYQDVFEYDGKTVRRVISSPDPVISLSVDTENNLWVGSLSGGVKRYSDNTFDTWWEPPFLRKKSVTKVHQDRDGAMWYTTLENGVFYAPNMDITNYSLPDQGRVKSVNASGKHIIVGDKSGVVRFFEKTSMSVSHEKKFDYNILSVFCDDRKNFWISAHSAIALYDSSFNLKQVFPEINAADFYQNSDGTVFGLGSQRLFHFGKNNELLSEHVFEGIYRNFLVHDSLLFLAARIGLHIQDFKFRDVQVPELFSKFKISDMMSLNDSVVMVSTIGNGFTLFNTSSGKTTHYDSENKFIANNIYATLTIDSMLWIGTEKGLAATSIHSLLDGKPRFNYLGKMSGLGANTISFLAAGSNSIWAFYDDGFSVIPNNLSRYANEKPAFYLRYVKSNGQLLEFKDKLVLQPEQKNLTVGFGFISYNNPIIFLRYRIDERDAWIYTNEHEIDLTSLAPGTYKLDLQFSADNINWFPALDPIGFTLSPHWYGEWYVYPMAMAVILVLGYLYFRNQQSIYRQKNIYLKIINDHQQKLIQSEVVTVERERNRIAKELHDGIGTTLTAIKLRVNRILENYRDPLADEMEEQFQSTIGEIKNIIYGLTPPSLERYGLFTALKNYVNRISKNVPITITLKTFGYEVSKYEFNIIIFRVIQELLSNSIKHSYAKNISIHLSTFDDMISIIYEDDGIGFQYDPVQNGLGLDSIESRIQSINGTLKFDSGDFGISYNIEIPLAIKKEVI
jgi:signal transduction histidine kinase/ligand-binding sensor domain-containing protein